MNFFKNNPKDEKKNQSDGTRVIKIVNPNGEESKFVVKGTSIQSQTEQPKSVPKTQVNSTNDDIQFIEPYVPVNKPYTVYPTYTPTGEKINHVTQYTITPVPTYEKTNVIIFVVENTLETQEYKQDILKLMNKIINDNTSSLFMFLKLSDINNFSELLNYTELKKQMLPECMLSSHDVLHRTTNIVQALMHINNFVKSNVTGFKVITSGGIKYQLQDAKIIFIGTGKYFYDYKTASAILRLLRANQKITTIKYFCIKDEDAINLSAVGFPVIGHIESNFYK